MLSFEDVYHAPVSRLDKAAEEWKKLHSKYQGLAERMTSEVLTKVKDDWDGEAADAALKQIKDARRQLEAAGTESRAIALLLEDAAKEFRSAQNKLKKIADEDAPAQKFKVTAAGRLIDTITAEAHGAQHDPQYRTHYLPQRQQQQAALEKAILAARREATAADEAAAWALKQDPNGSSNTGFNTKAFTSLDSAEARQALNLAAKGSDLSTAELKKLNHLLAINKDDPGFAKQFALGLGPQGTLEFWDKVTRTRGKADASAFIAHLDDLEKNLGVTLANATRVGGKEMAAWENSIIALGDEKIGTDPRFDRTYGFQAMSNLMRHGNYDDAFLTTYGKSLLEFEKEHTLSDGDVSSLPWQQDVNYSQLHFGTDGDPGHDPMIGFMEALGHNPDAATDFFNDTENFDYLTEERPWPDDHGPDAEELPSYNSLGHALEAATTGTPYDSPEHKLNRDNDTTAVAEKVIEKYGSDPKFMHEQPGIADSLAKIGAAYIDDINYALEQGGEEIGNETAFPADDRDRAISDRYDALKFISTLGQDKSAHGIFSASQDTYTTSILVDNPPHTSEGLAKAESAMDNHAKIQGVLDKSRMDQVGADYIADAEAANKELAQSADWLKWGVGATIGVGVGVIPVPGAQTLGAALVPVAAETVGSAFSTFVEQKVEEEVEEQVQSPDQRIQSARDDLAQAGRGRVTATAQAYLLANNDALLPNEERGLLRRLDDEYYAASNGKENYHGHPPYER